MTPPKKKSTKSSSAPAAKVTHVRQTPPAAPAEPKGTAYICPGCGRRYADPTTCTVEHEPLEAEPHKVPVSEVPAAEPAA